MFKMEMQWKSFSVDLGAVDASLRGSYPHYTGNQAHSLLELWFTEEPSSDDKAAIQALWDGIHSDHAMVASYKSRADLATAAAAKKASGKAKLLALGLSEDEIAAMNLS